MLDDFTAVIVTFNSEYIIYKTIEKLPKNLKIIVVENSNNLNFKNEIERKFSNLKCILSGENIGWGRATNLGIKQVKTEYILFLNPDLIVYENTIIKIINKIKDNEDIGVISPETVDYKNRTSVRHGFNFFSKVKSKKIHDELLEVDYLSGHIFLTRKNILDRVGYLDENIFLNFEEIDLLKRISNKGYKIFIQKGIYAKHLEGKSADIKHQYEMELSSKWHFNWSRIYYTRKHYGILFSILTFFYFTILNFSKLIFFIIKYDKKKINLMVHSIFGLFNSIIGKSSYYRPKIKK